MPTFGFSAFLKLICLNDRPQRTEIRDRIVGRGEGAYDFHASLKRLAKDLTVRRQPIEEVLAKAESIKQLPERKSATNGLAELHGWLSLEPRLFINFEDSIYLSPAKHFSVRFTSDIGLSAPTPTAIHVWNTKVPTLSDNLVRMALALASSAFSDRNTSPHDLGVLDLRRHKLILLSETTLSPTSGQPLAERLDRIFLSVKSELEKKDLPPERPVISPRF